MSRQFATNVTTIYDIFCPVPFLPSPFGFRRFRAPCNFATLAHRNRSDFCDLRLRCPSQTPEIARFPKQEKAMLHCDLRLRWKVASDLRFRAAISEPKTPCFCGISGDLAQSMRKSLAIATARFWCAKFATHETEDPFATPKGI